MQLELDRVEMEGDIPQEMCLGGGVMVRVGQAGLGCGVQASLISEVLPLCDELALLGLQSLSLT